jgi:hypothetical protein
MHKYYHSVVVLYICSSVTNGSKQHTLNVYIQRTLTVLSNTARLSFSMYQMPCVHVFVCILCNISGPDLYEQPYFSAPDFPNNMPDIWDKQVSVPLWTFS